VCATAGDQDFVLAAPASIERQDVSFGRAGRMTPAEE
jgi:hypothetical protein